MYVYMSEVFYFTSWCTLPFTRPHFLSALLIPLPFFPLSISQHISLVTVCPCLVECTLQRAWGVCVWEVYSYYSNPQHLEHYLACSSHWNLY